MKTTNQNTSIREDFPAIRSSEPFVYLDSAATSLKPQAVIDAVNWFLADATASIHRGVHRRTAAVSERYEDARSSIARWFGVADSQVVMTRGVTDAINLVRRGLTDLESVITTVAEHHSNLLPWRDLDCRFLDCDDQGRIDPNQLERELRTRPAQLVTVSHVGNVTGAVQPIRALASIAHRHGSLFLVDAAQSAWHLPIPAEDEVDLIACSGHKMLGPSGTGALVGSLEALERLEPVTWGGGMVESVRLDDLRLQPIPQRFEAGTPPIESVLGFGAAVEYLESIGVNQIEEMQTEMTKYLVEQVKAQEGVKIIGPCDGLERAGLVSFVVDKVESHVAARIFSQRAGICVRSGFHCAEPLHRRLKVGPTLRASLHVYSSKDDIDTLAEQIRLLPRVG